MSNYSDELESRKDYEVNTVIQIGSLFYAEKQPDSGLVIDAEKLVVNGPKINGVKLDIRKAKTPIGSLSFELRDQDPDYFTTVEIMKTEGMFLEQDVVAYTGFIRGATDPFDFADYVEISRTNITSVKKVKNAYSIISKEVTHKLNKEAINAESPLTTALLVGSSTLDVVDATVAPFTAGLIKVGNEFMEFNGITSNTLENLVRGVQGTPAIEHNVGEAVQFVTQFDDVNPIDILLQIILSDTGDLTNHGTYDVLNGGLAIDPADVDIVSFTDAKTEFFLNDQYDLVSFGEPNILKYIEKQILNATGTRIVARNGKISLAVLDQISLVEDVPELDESTIIGTPTWSLTSDKIVNEVWVSYDYNLGTEEYEKTEIFQNADSLATFGVKKPLKLRLKGVTTALNGAVIANKQAQRLLTRLGTARGSISLTAQLDASTLLIGDNALITHRFIPQEGGTLGMSQQLEAMTQSIDLAKGQTKMKFEFTSYTGIRIPFIAPSPLIVSVTDQSTFEVPDGGCYKVGDCLRLWDDTGVDYFLDANNFVQSISGDFLTMTTPWVTTLTTDIRIKNCDYDEASPSQKNRYAFIGENTGFFTDGTKSYQILF